MAVSGLEMSQNSLRISWDRDEVDQRLKGAMKRIHEQCVQYGETKGGIDYLKGANVAGFVKVAGAMLAYGVVWVRSVETRTYRFCSAVAPTLRPSCAAAEQKPPSPCE